MQPHFLRSLPLDTSHILVCSQVGSFQFIDITGLLTQDSMTIHQIPSYDENTPPCLFTLAASPSGQFLAFGDGFGVIHSWVNTKASLEEEDSLCLNPYAQPTEFPDVPQSLPYIDFESPFQGAPLSSVPVCRFR